MTLWSDIRHGARRLVTDWGLTLAAVATLSIGVAVNMVGFTLITPRSPACCPPAAPFASIRW